MRWTTILLCAGILLGAAGLFKLCFGGNDDSQSAQPQRAIIVFDAGGSDRR